MPDPQSPPQPARSAAELRPSSCCRRWTADGGAVRVSVGGESDSAMVAPLDQALRIRRAGGRLIVVSGSLALDRFSALLGLDRLLEPVDRPPGAADAAAVGARATAPEQTRPMLISA